MAPPRQFGHGSRACYRRGCRRPECVTANTDWLKAYNRRTGRRKPRRQYDVERHVHPSLNCYKRHGCRCLGCTAINTDDVRRRADQRAWREFYVGKPENPGPRR